MGGHTEGEVKTAEEVPVSTRARNTIVGDYQWISTNHHRPVYRRVPDVDGLSVNIYFWDGSHGKSFHGWWFGFTVGCGHVWAQHPDQESWYPPQTGWRLSRDSGDTDAEIAIQWGADNSGMLRVVTHTAN